MPNEITPIITCLSANILGDTPAIELRTQTRFYNRNVFSLSWQSPTPWVTTHFSFAGAVIVGGPDSEWIVGGSDADTLDGAGGADTMVGSGGNDTYIVDNTGDVVGENPGQGIDYVLASVNYTLDNNVENLTLTGSATQGTGNSLANRIIGNGLANALIGGAGHDTLDGGVGIDTLSGGTGNDVYYVDNLDDIIIENAGDGIETVFSSGENYTLSNNVENLTLTGVSERGTRGSGNNLANVITGSAGLNVLDGGIGADTMIGGAGDDYYYIDDIGDVVIENAGEGDGDTVHVWMNYTLGDHIEDLELFAAGTRGTGNTLDNWMRSHSSNATLDGGSGDDTLVGAGNNSLYIGGSGNDHLTVGYGPNTLVGGSGDDTYYYLGTETVIIENAGEGHDTLTAALTSVTLADHVEDLIHHNGLSGFVAKGNDENNKITAYNTSGSGTLDGGAGDDYIIVLGGTGDHVLIGGAGIDTLSGGGNDTYYVDNSLDVVVERENSGYDTVMAYADYTLSSDIEELQLHGSAISGTGNDLGNKIIGNASGNNLQGAGGNDTLDGSSGADTMAGGIGDDSYYVNSTTDRVTELASEGIDTIYASVSWTLNANVERLVLMGSAARGVGNALDNVIQGNAANNNLNGGNGSDTLTGGAGTDQFVLAHGNTGVDTITDFVRGTDQIVLSGFDFSSLEDGYTLVIDGGPVDELATLLYNTATGVLSFDEDGTGAGAAISMALFSTKPVLTTSDFILI
jgi:trimeric autotransporter adhesin